MSTSRATFFNRQNITYCYYKQQAKCYAYITTTKAIQDPKQSFRVNFYFRILNTAIISVEERFRQLKEISDSFGLLYNIHGLNKKTTQEILDSCYNLEKVLTGQDEADKDIYSDALELCSELKVLGRYITQKASPFQVLKYISKNKLETNYPNTYIALRILNTIPVNVASAERSLSKLKLIKTYIRSTMTQERLSGLTMLSIEQEIIN